EEGPAREGHDGLRHRQRERPQAGPLPAGEHERLHQRRPMPSYVKPAPFMSFSSRKLRPSTTSGFAIRRFTSPAQSSSRNSGHSVTSTAPSAPSSASSAVGEIVAPATSSRGRSAATGSYTRTLA